MSMSRGAKWVSMISVAFVLLAVVATVWLLAFNGVRVGVSSTPIDTTGDGPPWTNQRTGQAAGPDYVGDGVPFENDDGCGSENFTSSISYRRGWYVQGWTGPQNSVTGRYLPATRLPKTATFTGWARPGERLWVDPEQQLGPGVWKFLYVERADGFERWPQATFGCL